MNQLKYQFWKNVTSEKCNSDGLNTFGHRNLSSHLGVIAIVFSNHTQKWRQICPKVFNPSEFHFSEVTFFQNWYFRSVSSSGLKQKLTTDLPLWYMGMPTERKIETGRGCRRKKGLDHSLPVNCVHSEQFSFKMS